MDVVWFRDHTDRVEPKSITFGMYWILVGFILSVVFLCYMEHNYVKSPIQRSYTRLEQLYIMSTLK